MQRGKNILEDLDSLGFKSPLAGKFMDANDLNGCGQIDLIWEFWFISLKVKASLIYHETEEELPHKQSGVRHPTQSCAR